MSKAEERALEAYPIVMSQYSDNCKEYDSNESDRLTFIEGYHQAEKDLALTWEDVSKIRQIMFDYNWQLRSEIVENKASLPKDEEYCREVLDRFKKTKKVD